ncbi:MAG: efflux RND transporter periplasmic adaptor subunit [Verrucomicrobiales bacterium]|nr:efflux RND transporter periplasmic adaptor subunit [Verrucomicrobiales bacterium]
MKKILIFSIISISLGFILGALVFTGGGSPTGSGKDAGVAKDEIWTCSMHPNVKAPNPGLCPICAMDLIPLSSMGPAGGERDYTMSEAAKKLAGITTVEVIRQLPHAEIRLFGKVVYDESRIESVSARFDGRLDKLFVNYTGVRVKKGDHLGLVYSPDLLTAQSELITAKKFGNSSAISLARDKLRLWGFSRDKIRQIESTGKVVDQLTIDAPAAGIVTHLNVKEGDYFKTGNRFFQIADLSQVWVMLQAYESDLSWLRYGQTVKFTAESYPGRTFEGVISFIPPDLDPMTRTVSIRVNVQNPEELLKPGMFIRGIVKAQVSQAGKIVDPSLSGKWISPMHPEVVKDGPGKCDVCGMDLVPAEELGYSTFDSGEAGAPLLVPASAVLNTGKRSIVYVELPEKEEPTFEGRDMLLGAKAGGFYIVEAGLNEGEKVVKEGGFVIDSALQIQAKDSMMLPGDNKKPLYPKISVPDSFLTHIDQVLQSYYDVQSALAADSLTPAQTSAEEGRNRVSGMEHNSIPEQAHEVWMDLGAKLEKSFASISKSADIKKARTEFKTLTSITEEMVLRFGTAFLPVIEMHCPMAFNDTGASWFQPGGELLNPYFGAEMLRCGTVEDTLSKGGSFPVPAKAAPKIEAIVRSYFSIAGDLANDDNSSANGHAGELIGLVQQLEAKDIDHPVGSAAWTQLAEALGAQLTKMAGEDSITLNRVHFEKLTAMIKAVVEQFGSGLPFTVNQAHCPMAFNDEGADWLVDSEEINNPYFGAKMLKCGEITETIYEQAR